METNNKKVGVSLQTKFIKQGGNPIDKEFIVFKTENAQVFEWKVGNIGIKRADVESLITQGHPCYDMALSYLAGTEDQDTKEMIAAGVVFLEKLHGSEFLGMELVGELFEVVD